MKAELVSLLCCPADGSNALHLNGRKVHDGQIVSGHIGCETCGAQYPIVDGIPHLMAPRTLSPEIEGQKMREQFARDRDSSGYDETVPPRQTVIEIEAIVSALRPQQNEVVVDLGAGTGRLTLALARAGARVIAVDLSPRSLEINRQKCAEAGLHDQVFHVVADACHVPIRTSTVDRLASGMLLEHICPDEERQRCIDEIHRVLRPRGRMAITVYNYSWSLRRRKARREGLHEGDLYFYRFEGNELAGLLRGFRRIRVSGILNLPARIASPMLDRLLRGLPSVAIRSGDLLFAIADR